MTGFNAFEVLVLFAGAVIVVTLVLQLLWGASRRAGEAEERRRVLRLAASAHAARQAEEVGGDK
jgi:hypothetical protein